MDTLFTNKKFIKISTIFVALLCLLAVGGIINAINGGGRYDKNAPNTISFQGHGEVMAVPDIATISLTIESSKDTQAAASNEVNTKTQKVLDFLKSSGIEEKDTKTENYNSYPKYSYPTPCPMYYNTDGSVPPCYSGESKIIGFTVSQGITAKIRAVDDTSKIVDGINKIGVTNMSGPNFTIDKEDSLKADARQKAIDDAKSKAKELAKELGVSLKKITSFSEGGGAYPMYYDKAMSTSGVASPAPAQIPKGQNTISSDVTITYEIR